MAAGLVPGRQRPQTTSGVTFVALEGSMWWSGGRFAEHRRCPFLESRLMMVEDTLEAENGVRHLIARWLHDLTPLMDSLDVRSRDFR